MGLRMGIIKAALSLVGLVVGVVLAGNFYKPVSNIFSFINNEQVANILAFALILVLVIAAASLLARLLRTIIKTVMLGWVDNIGGAVFGFLFGAIFWGAVLATWVKFFGSDLVTGSFLARFLLDYFPLVLGLLPGEFDAVRDFF
jgi:membrane protein required for colicin V production